MNFCFDDSRLYRIASYLHMSLSNLKCIRNNFINDVDLQIIIELSQRKLLNCSRIILKMAKYQILSDAELAVMFKDGDYGAFTEIYNRNWEPLLKYVSRIINEDVEDAQDVVQEVFVSFWKRHQDIDIRNFSSWLFGAARKNALFYLRTSSNRIKYLESLSDFLTEVVDPLNEELDVNDLAAFIDREMGNLPEKMKEVFVLSRQENLSHKEIAERLGISDQTVKKQINNVLKHFRLKMNADSAGLIAISMIILFPAK